MKSRRTKWIGGWRNLDEGRNSSLHSHWWKDLRQLNQIEESIKIKEQIQWKVRCGDMTRFWEDKWLGGDRSLMDKFPTLYLVSNQQQQTIRHMGSHKEEGWINMFAIMN